MKYLPLFLLALSISLSACKSKLEKKDVPLEEMQAGEGKRYDPVLADADTTPVYKSVNGKDFHLNVYYPAGHQAGDNTPCIVFFFGGGFINGNPAQFAEQCKHFAQLGMVAISADYRVISRDNGNATACVMDAKSAYRYIRQHATELGIDPNRIVGSGGSAGAAISLTSAMNEPGFNDAADDTTVSCVPNALVLFNPVVNLEEFDYRIRKFEGAADELNPLTHINRLPPTIIYHGTKDEIAGYSHVATFTKEAVAKGNNVKLVTYTGLKHGFFQRNKHNGKYYAETLQMTDDWLKEMNYIK
jgi:acetyl esterase